MAFYERKDPNNYTLGGVRLWVNELLDSTAAVPKYAGFVDLGCVEEAPLAQAVEFQEHFCAATGTRVKDRKIVKQVSSTITVTLLEVDPQNLRLFFLGGDITTVAASPGGGTVTVEVMRLTGTDRKILKDGINAATIVVKDYTAGTTRTLTSDYTVEDYYSWKAIRRVAGGLIADGDYVKVSYVYDILANKYFYPLTSVLKTAQVLFVGSSDTGQEIVGRFDNCQINPTGDFNWNSNDWTTFQLEIDILDNSIAAPTIPFGTITSFGSGADL